MPLRSSIQKLREGTGALSFGPPVAHVYAPLEYAHRACTAYVQKYARKGIDALLLGMNPGPWGMAQTGVPFGEISAVRDWMSLRAKIQRPDPEHPKRPIEGFDCTRSEVSGRRLWGLFSERFGSPVNFFKEHFVANYCPLAFMESSARNLTPDKLPVSISQRLEEACDWHLRELVALLQPEWVVGVGSFAEARARQALKGQELKIGRILHPSPASPAANRDWAGTALKQFETQGIW